MSKHNFNKGAQWLKCDLHLHTPDTKLNSKGFEIANYDKWDRYCQVIEESDVTVFGITDYFSVENYFKFIKLFIEKYPLSNKVFFPNIEFRLDVSVNKAAEEINLHVIFSNEVSETEINDFLSKLDTTITKNQVNLTCNKLSSVNDFQKASVKYSDLKIVLRKVFGDNQCYIILAASNNQGLRADTKSPRKLNISDEIDKICQGFFGSSNNVKYFLNKDRYEPNIDGTMEIAKKCPVFSGSDAHSFNDLENKLGKEYEKRDAGNNICDCSEITWIKADPTFDGLKQVLIEPEERIFIGKTPAIIEKVHDNRTKYIKSLSIDWIESYDGKHGKWFKQIEIELNPELVAIIGNKGSGKSALADIIGLCGHYKNQKDFSFLREKKFREGNVSKYFEAKLQWLSDEVIPKILSDTYDKGEMETVKYLPQGYFETLTNEISTTEAFQKEIENVVFTHLNDEDKLGFQSFEELVEHHKQSVDREIKSLIETLNDLNIQIIKLEKKLNPIYKAEIQNKLRQKENELQALVEPIQVKNPNEDEVVSAQNRLILEEIERIKAEVEKIEKNIFEREREKSGLLIELRDIKELKKEIEFKFEEIKSFKEQRKWIAEKYGFDFNTLLGLTSNLDSLNTLVSNREAELRRAKEFLGEELSDVPHFSSLKKQLENLNSKLGKEQEKLDTALKQYQLYLNDKKNWEDKKNKITGSESNPDTILFFKKELDYLENLLEAEIQKSKEKRIEISEKIFDKKQDVVKVYKDVKQKLDDIIRDNIDLLGGYKINISANLSFKSNYSEEFLGYILKNQSGTFYSNEGGNVQFNKLIKDVDFDKKDGVTSFLANTLEALFNDKRENYNQKRYLDEQVRDSLALYNSLFSLSFLDYNYQLMQGNKKLQQLSPGERGALLLIFYLLLDKDNKPLIIDQPEDNLDNHSVANILVPFIRKAKANRQIILVTHNPNLAVVSDAEQVIFVNIDKENDYTFEYQSGSIENRSINERIVQVLEGAMPAFNKRKQKYYE